MRPCSNWHATGDWEDVVVVVDLPFGGGGATLSGSCVCACQAPEDHAIELVHAQTMIQYTGQMVEVYITRLRRREKIKRELEIRNYVTTTLIRI